MVFRILFILTLISISIPILHAQNIKVLSTDTRFYPKTTLSLKIADNNKIEDLQIYEQDKQLDFTAKQIKSSSVSFVLYLIDYQSFNYKEQKVVFAALKKCFESKQNDFVNIGFVFKLNGEIHFFPLSYYFVSPDGQFVLFAEKHFLTKLNTVEQLQNIYKSFEEALLFTDNINIQTGNKKIVLVTSKKISLPEIDSLQNIQKKFSDIKFKIAGFAADTLRKRFGYLLNVPEENTLKAWHIALLKASEELDLTNISSMKQYKIEFICNSDKNYSTVELHFQNELLRVPIVPERINYRIPEYLYWLVLTIFLGVLIMLMLRIKKLSEKITQLKETLSLLFDKKMKILSKQTENPVLEIKLEQDVTNHRLKKRTTTIGRDKSCDIVIKDMTVSAHHATISNEGGEFFIKDNDSTNGIFVNDIKVSKKSIKPGDVIRLGKAILTMHY